MDGKTEKVLPAEADIDQKVRKYFFICRDEKVTGVGFRPKLTGVQSKYSVRVSSANVEEGDKDYRDMIKECGKVRGTRAGVKVVVEGRAEDVSCFYSDVRKRLIMPGKAAKFAVTPLEIYDRGIDWDADWAGLNIEQSSKFVEIATHLKPFVWILTVSVVVGFIALIVIMLMR